MKNNQIPNFRTDLADERTEICKSQSQNKDIDGIETNEKKVSNNISVNTVNVLNENGSKKIDKKVGKYITINISNIDNMTKEDIKLAEKILKEEDYKILYLYIIGEYKHREIAEILNLPLGTVTWKYKNSLKKLKKVLLEEEKKDAQ